MSGTFKVVSILPHPGKPFTGMVGINGGRPQYVEIELQPLALAPDEKPPTLASRINAALQAMADEDAATPAVAAPALRVLATGRVG